MPYDQFGLNMNHLELRPSAQGLYDPQNEHDACGVGFVAHIKGKKTHDIITQGLKILENLDHRGAVGADPLMGDGAGILIQIPDELYRSEMKKQESSIRARISTPTLLHEYIPCVGAGPSLSLTCP